MKKKGFTLTELLAVIVVIGILITVAGISVINVKKNTNINEAEQIVEMLKDLGSAIYTYEKISGKKQDGYFYNEYNKLGIDEFIYISFEELDAAGYLEEVKKEGETVKITNPSGGGGCTGYLTIIKTTDGPKFDACLMCPGIEGYETGCTTDDGYVKPLLTK